MKKILFGLIFIFILILVQYMFFVEPNMLFIKNYSIEDNNLQNMRIVFISDLHLESTHKNKLIKIVNHINSQNPDLVLCAGDFLYNGINGSSMTENDIAQGLSKIKSKYGFFTVLGNHDCVNDEFYLISELEKNGLVVLQNTNIYIKEKNLFISGIEDDTFRTPDLDKALQGTRNPRIILMHSPDFYEKLTQEVTLVLAGHNHGGQICLPIIGSIFLPAKTKRKYRYGFYDNSYKKMVVTNGIGNSIINARLNCVPEIVIIDFK